MMTRRVSRPAPELPRCVSCDRRFKYSGRGRPAIRCENCRGTSPRLMTKRRLTRRWADVSTGFTWPELVALELMKREGNCEEKHG